MQISGTSDAYAASQAQRTLAMLMQQGLGSAGQTAPSDSQDAPAAGLPPQSPAGQFAPDTLSGLISAQQDQPPSAADFASQIMSQVDTDGDGELSPDEIAQALGAGTSATDLTSALSKLDTDGDGKISSDELTSGLQAAQKAHHHHHHHHHGQDGAQSATNDATSDTSTTASTDGSTTPSQADTDAATSVAAG